MQMRLAWPPFTRNVKITLGVLAALFLASLSRGVFGAVDRYLLVSRDAVLADFELWTVLTYAFFHQDFGHLLFNALALWMFGSYLDQVWSARRFWVHSLVCAVGGGVAVVGSQVVFGVDVATLGYSGAVMGLIAAFAWYHWNRRVNLLFFPMTGKTMLLVFAGLDALLVVVGRQPVSIAAHLGGMLTGLLLVTGTWRPREWRRAWRRWRTRRNLRVVGRQVDRKRGGQWVN